MSPDRGVRRIDALAMVISAVVSNVIMAGHRLRVSARRRRRAAIATPKTLETTAIGAVTPFERGAMAGLDARGIGATPILGAVRWSALGLTVGFGRRDTHTSPWHRAGAWPWLSTHEESALNKFSEAYEQATQALGEDKFAGEVAKLRADLRALLAAGGPDASKSELLNKLRHTLKTAGWKTVSGGKGVGPEAARVQVVIEAAGTEPGKLRRAATVKMLRHLYHTKSAGGQAVWVYSPPMAYTKWIFDEVSGADDTRLAEVLGKPEDEVYTEKQRDTMSDALQTARKVCLDVVTKLSQPDDATLNVVRRYFGAAGTSKDDLKTTAATLRAGYQKIANACNASVVVISDEPIDRNSGGWSDWAFIYTSESMRVIYLQDAWLQKAGEVKPSNQSPLFRCARTIVHELSHKEVSTEDVVYGPKGLQVEGSSALTADYALHNADSWAYFSMDLTGNLTGPDATNGTTPCSAIREVPTRVLTTA